MKAVSMKEWTLHCTKQPREEDGYVSNLNCYPLPKLFDGSHFKRKKKINKIVVNKESGPV